MRIQKCAIFKILDKYNRGVFSFASFETKMKKAGVNPGDMLPLYGKFSSGLPLFPKKKIKLKVRSHKHSQQTRDWAAQYQKHLEYQQAYRKTEKYKEIQKNYRKSNREQINARKKEKYKANSEKYVQAAKKWIQENPEKHRQIMKKASAKWRAENPEKFNQIHRDYSKANPKYMRAHSLSRLIPLKVACENCGSTETLQKHHPDYTQPRLIETLCNSCHLEKHGRKEIQRVAVSS